MKTLWGLAAMAGVAAIGTLGASVFMGPIFGGVLANSAFAVAFFLISLLAYTVASEQDGYLRLYRDALARQDDLIYRLEQRVHHLSCAVEDLGGGPIDFPSRISSEPDREHLKRTSMN